VGSVLYSVGVSGEDNQVTIVQNSISDEGGYIVTVQSARGFGQASMAWWGDTLPHPLWFQLPFSGLEQFSLIWAAKSKRVSVNVSVNSSDQLVLQSLQVKRAGETEITPNSPYWLHVTQPTPQQPGYLLRAPTAFIADAPRMWAIAWMDFYR
jgi:hypothetical protein